MSMDLYQTELLGQTNIIVYIAVVIINIHSATMCDDYVRHVLGWMTQAVHIILVVFSELWNILEYLRI